MTMEERRKKKRIRMVSQLEIQVPSLREPINAFTVNVSREGVGFCCGKKIEIGDEIKVKIFFEESAKDKYHEIVTGPVRWVKQVSRIYEAGIEYTHTLNRAQHPKLLKSVGDFLT